MNINLHIERLVLDGVSIEPSQRDLLQVNVTNELTRLLNNGGLAPDVAQGVSLPRMSTTGIELTGSNPAELGQQIAQSVYGEIGHE